ncbi:MULTISPECIES: hypothetical protein [unclassified Microbacterium]|uniref:hypothetical protein n=1 Tax=unclassified Microbacterium TaxID=2609290 RepID=UPI000A6898A8|nr:MULTISPECIES: hypothetical protein [unclassified Microbacterium]MBN9191903.1 hypothetical protein [Microbacterium sp.]
MYAWSIVQASCHTATLDCQDTSATDVGWLAVPGLVMVVLVVAAGFAVRRRRRGR